MRTRGLALIVVVGVLGVVSVLAMAFVTMAQLERRASAQRVHAAKALLLARSGLEDALARLSAGQDAEAAGSRYRGEDWDDDGAVTGLEAAAESWRPGRADLEDCPLRHAMRPSFYRRHASDTDARGRRAPARIRVEGRERGYTGALAGDLAPLGSTYVLALRSSNAGIHVNGGALDAEDRDPDGPGVTGALAGSAAAEVAPLAPNGIPDHRDASPEGPNGFLVRLLDNLDRLVTATSSPALGAEVVGNRPAGGYASLETLRGVLGPSRFARFGPYLTASAWVDSSTLKPQPMDGRPRRFEDVDDTHRIGTMPNVLSGVTRDWMAGDSANRSGNTLNPSWFGLPGTGFSGLGTEASPWTQRVFVVNSYEYREYPVSWERGFVYAQRQLRLAPAAPEPRAPVHLNTAPREVLASVLLGLKGTTLEVWDGTLGFDGQVGLGNYSSQASEEAPWPRVRADYGMDYGAASRPWYAPRAYNPMERMVSNLSNMQKGGKPVLWAAPLGRLKEVPPLTREQALAVADQALSCIAQRGPFRTWAQFNTFVDLLPVWEDLDQDGLLNGAAYTVATTGGSYERRRSTREDLDGNGVLNRRVFKASMGNWGWNFFLWEDPGLAATALPPEKVPGLSFLQKDMIKAMANPNADLNDFNPDENLFKELDKSDLAGIAASPGSYAHTTEFALDSPGVVSVRALGRVLDARGRLLAQSECGTAVRAYEAWRDTTQADFMRGYADGSRPLAQIFPALPSPPSYPLSGGQALVSYPEPQTAGGAPAAGAAYDGQVGLGFIGCLTPPASWVSSDGTPDRRLQGDLFDALQAAATADAPAADQRGPFREALVRPAGQEVGHVFPDGVYSEKDAALKYPVAGNLDEMPVGRQVDTTMNLDGPVETLAFCLSFWVKTNWLPEASPRPHALLSLSPASKLIPRDPAVTPIRQGQSESGCWAWHIARDTGG